jgi:4-amino-4-deoxy-L-arabinose transferase-like glycosyltransferase
VGLGLFAILAWFVRADPVTGVTLSSSPFSDEGFNTVNARNLVQLGRWSTDEWNLYLVNLPFSLLCAAAFQVLGVSIVSARLVSIASVSITAAALAWVLRRVVGGAWALFGAVAFAASGLILYYGRLAYLEDLVVAGLTLGTLALASADRLSIRWGLFAGACFALAIGTKPIAAFPVAGVAIALALAGRPGRDVRRWLTGAAAALVALGLVWLVVIWLPNRDAVAMDLRIWAPEQLSLTPAAIAGSISSYVRGDNDGILKLLGPLLVLGAVGLAAIAVFRRRLDQSQARLSIACLGWALAGCGIVLIASYRPNRYFVPVVPAFAILAAIGFRLISQWLAELAKRLPWGRAARWARPGVPVALVAIAILLAAAPGLVQYAGWSRRATYSLPEIQDHFATLVPAGERVAGRESALFLMRSKAITLEVQLTQRDTEANAGDLYSAGVRWYLQPTTEPAPPGVPAAVWADRQTVACATWDRLNECLIKLR